MNDNEGREMTDYKTIEITKTVPVADRESLAAWLNYELPLRVNANGGEKAMGNWALDLIEEAGFELKPPTVTRRASGGTTGI